jgi:hypothetical protein
MTASLVVDQMASITQPKDFGAGLGVVLGLEIPAGDGLYVNAIHGSRQAEKVCFFSSAGTVK